MPPPTPGCAHLTPEAPGCPSPARHTRSQRPCDGQALARARNQEQGQRSGTPKQDQGLGSPLPTSPSPFSLWQWEPARTLAFSGLSFPIFTRSVGTVAQAWTSYVAQQWRSWGPGAKP